MSLPVDLNTITLTGTARDAVGNPLSGTVVIMPSTTVTDSTGHVIITPQPIVTSLSNGSFSVSGLACTDNANLAPSNWTYTITFQAGPSVITGSYLLPHSLGSSVDFSTLVPVATLPNTGPYALLGVANTFTAAQTFNGGIIASPAIPISSGGTGAISASAARTALGVAYDTTIADIKPIGTAASGATGNVIDAGHVHPLQPWQFWLPAYGAKGDGKMVHDGAMTATSAVLTCATSTPFHNTDIGKWVLVRGAAASGVTTLVAQITGFTDAGHVTLSVAASTTISNTVVIFASDDTAAIQAAVNAANTFAQASAFGMSEVTGPPAIYGVFGPLVTGGSTLGNSQITLPIPATTVNKVTLSFRTYEATTAATGAHWQQLVPQATGMTFVSGGVFGNATLQGNSVSANGNPCVIGGPTQPNHYGDSNLVFSNMNVVLDCITIITPFSANGWNYCGADFSGLSQATIRDVNITVSTVYASGDFNSASLLAAGLSKGLLMPANGNNDLNDIQNLSIWGGYTWGLFATEHTVTRNARLLYCWSAFTAVGNYFNSVSAGHAIYADQLSVEGCIYNVYVLGQGASGIGPYIDIVQMDTESAAPRLRDDLSGALATAQGTIKLTGLYTASTIQTDEPTTLAIINGQQPPGPAAALSYTLSTAFMNTYWRWATVTLAGGTVTAVKIGATMGGASAPAMTAIYSQSAAALPLMTIRVPPGGWLEIDGSVKPTTNSWVLD